MTDEQFNPVPEPSPYYGNEAMIAKQAGMSLGNLRTPTARSVLQARKDELLKQIKAIDDAITALDENPGVEKVLNILRKVGV